MTLPIPETGGGIGVSSIDALIDIMEASGIPHRVTSTYRDTTTYHGSYNAVDFAGPTPSIDSPELDRIAAFWATMGPHLLELIYAGPNAEYWKNGQRVPASVYGGVLASHHNHVHVAATLDGLILGAVIGGNPLPPSNPGTWPGGANDVDFWTDWTQIDYYEPFPVEPYTATFYGSTTQVPFKSNPGYYFIASTAEYPIMPFEYQDYHLAIELIMSNGHKYQDHTNGGFFVQQGVTHTFGNDPIILHTGQVIGRLVSAAWHDVWTTTGFLNMGGVMGSPSEIQAVSLRNQLLSNPVAQAINDTEFAPYVVREIEIDLYENPRLTKAEIQWSSNPLWTGVNGDPNGGLSAVVYKLNETLATFDGVGVSLPPRTPAMIAGGSQLFSVPISIREGLPVFGQHYDPDTGTTPFDLGWLDSNHTMAIGVALNRDIADNIPTPPGIQRTNAGVGGFGVIVGGYFGR